MFTDGITTYSCDTFVAGLILQSTPVDWWCLYWIHGDMDPSIYTIISYSSLSSQIVIVPVTLQTQAMIPMTPVIPPAPVPHCHHPPPAVAAAAHIQLHPLHPSAHQILPPMKLPL